LGNIGSIASTESSPEKFFPMSWFKTQRPSEVALRRRLSAHEKFHVAVDAAATAERALIHCAAAADPGTDGRVYARLAREIGVQPGSTGTLSDFAWWPELVLACIAQDLAASSTRRPLARPLLQAALAVRRGRKRLREGHGSVARATLRRLQYARALDKLTAAVGATLAGQAAGATFDELTRQMSLVELNPRRT
jgi:hypothetical protein